MALRYVIREPVSGGWVLTTEPTPPYRDAVYTERAAADRMLAKVRVLVPPPFPQAQVFEEEY